MSHKAVENIISKAVIDTQFREQLFTAPDKAMAGADLTEDEKKALRNLSREKFNASLGQLEELSAAGGAGIIVQSPELKIQPELAKFDWTRIGYAPSNTN
jgi:hypothetical protein